MIHNIEMEYINAESILENHFKTRPQYIYIHILQYYMYTYTHINVYTLWLFNIAMKNGPNRNRWFTY